MPDGRSRNSSRSRKSFRHWRPMDLADEAAARSYETNGRCLETLRHYWLNLQTGGRTGFKFKPGSGVAEWISRSSLTRSLESPILHPVLPPARTPAAMLHRTESDNRGV